MITETGRMVLRAVPPDRRERPAVAELREALRSPRPARRCLVDHVAVVGPLDLGRFWPPGCGGVAVASCARSSEG
jgi:hypothetical protein